MRDAPDIDMGRTRIGAFCEADADALAALGDDPAIARMLASLPSPFTPALARDRIERSAYAGRPGYRLAIRNSDGALVGEIGLGPEAEPTVSYWVGCAHWGMGHAGRALRGMVEDAFGRFDIAALTAECYADNPASIHLLERAGFAAVGERFGECSALRSPANIVIFRLPRESAQ